MVAPLGKDLICLVMQYLDEEKFKDALHSLERESGLFFNMSHFEEMILAGKWNEVEMYLSRFTKLEDNRFSMKIYFEIRKQNYLEALDSEDRGKAVDILRKDLKVFGDFNPDLSEDMIRLITLKNFRENEQLAGYTDTTSARRSLAAELKRLIEENPLFCDKLQFPSMRASRLRMMINQSLNWQHSLCPNPRQNIPDIETLFVDHSCRHSNEPIALFDQLSLNPPTPRADPSCLGMGANMSPPVVQTPLPMGVSAPVTPDHQTVSVTAPLPTVLPIPAASFQKAPSVRERVIPPNFKYFKYLMYFQYLDAVMPGFTAALCEDLNIAAAMWPCCGSGATRDRNQMGRLSNSG